MNGLTQGERARLRVLRRELAAALVELAPIGLGSGHEAAAVRRACCAGSDLMKFLDQASGGDRPGAVGDDNIGGANVVAFAPRGAGR